MYSSAARGKEKEGDSAQARTSKSRLEEAMGRLDLTEDEAVPLVVNDAEGGSKTKWTLAGKVLFRNVFHIQTISSALRPAWGNPRGLEFRPVGENMFLADFESQRDRDRVRDGSPWHVSKNAVILEEFVECMQPSELRFEKLQLWARVLNLPFNLRNATWGKAIAKQIDKTATQFVFDPVGGYLRVRVTVDINKPLQRGLLIDSAARQSRDWYDIQYEHIPHFCFSCGRLGHSDLFCPTPGSKDEYGKWPFGAGLRAPDDRKKSGSSENSSRDNAASHNSKRETSFSSTMGEARADVISPGTNTGRFKRTGDGTKKVYRKVGLLEPLASVNNNPDTANLLMLMPVDHGTVDVVEQQFGAEVENESNKKRKAPSNSDNSAEAVPQPCQSQ
jgi:hypothetical protein